MESNVHGINNAIIEGNSAFSSSEMHDRKLFADIATGRYRGSFPEDRKFVEFIKALAADKNNVFNHMADQFKGKTVFTDRERETIFLIMQKTDLYKNSSSLSSVFREYENTPDDLTGSKGASPMATPGKKKQVSKKINEIAKIVDKVERRMNMLFGRGQGKIFTLVPTYSSNQMNQGDYPLKIHSMVTGDGKGGVEPILINLSANELMNLPAYELHSMISGTVINNYLKSLPQAKTLREDSKVDAKDFPTQESEIRKLNEAIKNEIKAEKNLSEKIKEYLASDSDFVNKFNDFNAISGLIAGSIVESLDEEAVKNLANGIIDFSKFEGAVKEEANQFIASSDLAYATESRMSTLSSRAYYLAQDEQSTKELLDTESQYQALLSSRTAEKFKDMQMSSPESIKAFCSEYAKTFMASNGFKNVQITYESVGGLGTYYEAENRVNVNLTKIKGSVSELAMTLSHELTHACEGLKNALNNKQEKHQIGEDVSGAGLKGNTRAAGLLHKLNNYCYHVNPSERRGRLGELSALKFMGSMAGDSPAVERQVEESVARYERYQKKTIAIAENLTRNNELSQLRAEYNAIKSSLPSQAIKFFEERLEYLQAFVNGELSLTNDFASDLMLERDSIEKARETFAPAMKKVNPEAAKNIDGMSMEEREKLARAAAEAGVSGPGLGG